MLIQNEACRPPYTDVCIFLQLVEISKAQDIEAGDGTTSVVVMAGALLKACTELMAKGLHPTAISDGFQVAHRKAMEVIDEISKPVDLNDRD